MLRGVVVTFIIQSATGTSFALTLCKAAAREVTLQHQAGIRIGFLVEAYSLVSKGRIPNPTLTAIRLQE